MIINWLRNILRTPLLEGLKAVWKEYLAVFSTEAVPKVIELLLIIIFHATLLAPTVAWCLGFKHVSDGQFWLAGLVLGVMGYPLIYVHKGMSGLLDLTVRHYLQTRAVALAGAYLVPFFGIAWLGAMTSLVLIPIGIGWVLYIMAFGEKFPPW